jgi:hypothetical protein
MPILSPNTQEKNAQTENPQTAAVFLLVENRLLRDALAKVLDKKAGLEIMGACAFSALCLEQFGRLLTCSSLTHLPVRSTGSFFAG